jgi:hypothetical protein
MKGVQLGIALLAALLVVLGIGSLAWLNYQRGLETLTEIHSPVELRIGAGNQDAIYNLDLGNIDMTQGTSKDFVFCVMGPANQSYVLQLAHTTNIPFTYTIYHATETGTPVEYISDQTYTYYYNEDSLVQGAYLNEQDGLADETYHGETYRSLTAEDGSYDKVQANAEPLYWQTTGNETLPSGSGNTVRYYILHLSWPQGSTNDKETDIVYLAASTQ